MKVDKRLAKLTGYGELAALVRVVLPSHTAKRLAGLMDSEVATARFWLYRNFSRAQCRKAAALLLLELDRQDAEERAAARRRLIEIAGEMGFWERACGWLGRRCRGRPRLRAWARRLAQVTVGVERRERADGN